MLTETSAISGSKSPETRATPRRRPRVSQYDVFMGIKFDKATAAAIDEMVRRENRARSWVVSDLVVEGLKRLGALVEPQDRAA